MSQLFTRIEGTGQPLVVLHGWGMNGAVWQQTVDALSPHFRVHVVDLPGYGYAKVSKTSREKWQKFINGYLKNRENLMCVFVLIDSRHDLLKADDEFMEWLGENGVPFVIVFTKIDKLDERIIDTKIQSFLDQMSEKWRFLPQHFLTSSEKKIGSPFLCGISTGTTSFLKLPFSQAFAERL